MTKFHYHREGEEKLFFSVCCCFLLVSFCSRCMFLFSLLFKAGVFLLFACVWVLFCLFVVVVIVGGGEGEWGVGGGGGGL